MVEDAKYSHQLTVSTMICFSHTILLSLLGLGQIDIF